jgi:glycosyltransferase involved in cell wall biosynthesis
MGHPTVSVLLPARDAEATIDRAVKDILRQTVESLELIAVDDGSRDGTLARLQALANGDRRIRVLETEGLGVVHAANLAFRAAQGSFIARMDADDQCDPRRLEVSLAALEADPQLSGVGTGVEVFRDDCPVSPNLQLYAQWLNAQTTAEALFADRLVESPLCNPSATLRREAFEWAGGWAEGNFPEDWDLWLRLLQSGRRLRCVDEVLVRWRDHDRRVTRNDPRYGLERHLDLKARFLIPLLRKPVTLWGAGDIGLKLSRKLGGVDRFVDVNPRKIGMRIDGAPVVGVEEVGAPKGHLVAAVGAKGAREKIRVFLQHAGWIEGRDFTCAA